MSGESVVTTDQQRREIGTVKVNALRFVDSKQTTNRRQQVDQAGRFVFDVIFLNRARPTKDPGDANAALKIGTLCAT